MTTRKEKRSCPPSLADDGLNGGVNSGHDDDFSTNDDPRHHPPIYQLVIHCNCFDAIPLGAAHISDGCSELDFSLGDTSPSWRESEVVQHGKPYLRNIVSLFEGVESVRTDHGPSRGSTAALTLMVAGPTDDSRRGSHEVQSLWQGFGTHTDSSDYSPSSGGNEGGDSDSSFGGVCSCGQKDQQPSPLTLSSFSARLQAMGTTSTLCQYATDTSDESDVLFLVRICQPLDVQDTEFFQRRLGRQVRRVESLGDSAYSSN